MKILNSAAHIVAGKAAKSVVVAAGTSLAIGCHINASAVEVTVYGYAQADFVYSTDQDTGQLAGGYNLDTTPGLESRSSFQAYADTSRIGAGFKAGDFSGAVEGDFFGGDLRLRHAYGKYGNITAGQTWSTFIERDWIAYPATLDFDNPVGLSFDRRTQLRFTVGNFDFAIEDPAANLAAAAEGVSLRSKLPDFVARYASKGETFSWFLSGVVKNTEVDGGPADGDSASVVGLYGAARLNIGSAGALSATIMKNANNRATYGFAGGDFVVVGSNLESIDSTAFNLAFQGNAGPKASYNITYGEISFDDEFAGALGAGSPETFTTFHANYIYNITKNVSYGVELSRVEREDYSGNSADNTRLQMAVKYSF